MIPRTSGILFAEDASFRDDLTVASVEREIPISLQ